MNKITVALFLLLFAGGISAAEPIIAGLANHEQETTRIGTHVDTVSQAEKSYAIGLICYAGGDLINAEKFFAQALGFDPQMDKAAHALKQVKTEIELGN